MPQNQCLPSPAPEQISLKTATARDDDSDSEEFWLAMLEEMKAMRVDMQAMRVDMQAMNTALLSEMQALRADLRSDLHRLSTGKFIPAPSDSKKKSNKKNKCGEACEEHFGGRWPKLVRCLASVLYLWHC
jgi:hypothetical protein